MDSLKKKCLLFLAVALLCWCSCLCDDDPAKKTSNEEPAPTDKTATNTSTDTTVTDTSTGAAVTDTSTDTTVTDTSTGAAVTDTSTGAAETETSLKVTVAQTSSETTVPPTSLADTVLWPDYKALSTVRNGAYRLISPVPFPYFEGVSTAINIYGNGYVSFNNDYPRPTAPQYSSWQSAPNLFAVYWADIEYLQNEESNVYTYEDDQTLQDASLDSSLIKYVKKVVNDSDFQPLYAVAVTWVNAMPRPAKDYASDKATFQLILATDSQVSFAIRSYHNVWENTEVADRPHFTAAYTGEDGERVDLSKPSNERPEAIPLGIKNPSNASLECIKQTQAINQSLRKSIQSLPPCPCQIVQAANDPRFYKSASSCYVEGEGLQQQCCYSGYGQLISNSKGAQVPVTTEDSSLQNAYKICCSDESRLCDWFYQPILSPSCNNYKPPAYIGAGFGDPHLWAFDSNEYSLNVLGDYVLFRSGELKVEVQVRIGLSNNNKGTVFIAYAVNADNVTHQFNINNNKLLKDNKAVTQDRASVSSSGFSITIQKIDEALYHTISLDKTFNDVVGLMGSPDGNSDNDFKLKDGSIIPDNATQLDGKGIYDFASSWNVTGDSMITPPFVASSDEPSPSILPTTLNGTRELFNNGTVLAQAEQICDAEIFCLQEYYFSGSSEAAERILEHYKTISAQKELSNIKSPSFANTEAVIAINVSSPLNLTLVAADNQDVTFNVSSTFNNLKGLNLQGDTFTWDVNFDLPELRKLTYPQELQFILTDNNGMIAEYAPTINLCLCEKAEQCLSTPDTNKGEVNSLLCNCTGNQGGKFCEDAAAICKNCFDKNVSACNISRTENYCPDCPQGYKGDGILCYDVDECADKKNGCNYGCHNTPGGSFCYCQPGYRAEGKNCTEINKCEDNYNYCNSSDKVCKSVHGFASCSCIPGLVGVDKCIRAPYAFIGEVRFSITPSSQLNYSSFLYENTEEFQELKKIVVDAITLSVLSLGDDMYVDVLAFVSFENETATAARIAGNETFKETMSARFVYYTSNINRRSDDVKNALGTVTLTCTAVCRFGSISRTADPVTMDDDVDLCSVPEINICDKTTTQCHHKNNTIHCICLDGYTAYQQSLYSCKDIDECTVGSSNCAVKSACINTIGSYECNCARGRVWDAPSKTCIGDKCSRKPCQNDGNCALLYGGEDFTCSCTYGWNGQNCTDEDTDARRWKIAVITVSTILGFCCLALFIIVVVICLKQRKQKDTTSSSQYVEIKPLPRVRASQKASYEMEEKSDGGNMYAQLQADSASDKNSTFYSPQESRSNGTRAVYNNAAFDSDVVERL